MKVLIFLLLTATFSCHHPKDAVSSGNTVSTQQAKPATDSLPSCVRALIKEFSEEARSNPPRKIFSYMYKGARVYYVPPVCCDNFSDLYNDSCTVIAHPDGGFTGRGDGRLHDFSTEKSNEKLVWEDKRKN